MTFKLYLLREAERQAQHGSENTAWVAVRNRRSNEVHRREAAAAVGSKQLPALADIVNASRERPR
jgi:hypothetical protein